MSKVGRSQGWQVDAGHWPGALVSLYRGLSTKLLDDMAVASSRVSHPRGKMGTPIHFIT